MHLMTGFVLVAQSPKSASEFYDLPVRELPHQDRPAYDSLTGPPASFNPLAMQGDEILKDSPGCTGCVALVFWYYLTLGYRLAGVDWCIFLRMGN